MSSIIKTSDDTILHMQEVLGIICDISDKVLQLQRSSNLSIFWYKSCEISLLMVFLEKEAIRNIVSILSDEVGLQQCQWIKKG